MKKLIWTFGLIVGLVNAIWLFTMAASGKADFENSEVIGYTAMILSLSLIFVGIRQYRDKFNGGAITFGTAFKIGLYISLIASTVYVLAWLIDYYFFIPDFMDQYAAHTIQKMRESHASEAQISEHMKEMEGYKEMYRNPVFVVLLTYMEILPLGIVISLISAAIMKRKPAIEQYGG